MLTKPIVFFDLETTGKSVTKDRIVQLHMKKLDGNLQPAADPLSLLINPGIPISAEATAIHGITDEMVKDAPKFNEVASLVMEYLGTDNVGGYNIKNFDVPFLCEELARCNITWPLPEMLIIDSYKVFSIKEQRNLTEAVRFYCNRIMEGAHDAGNDVDATVDVFGGQLNRYPDLAAMDDAALAAFCSDGIKTLDLAGKIYLNKDNVPCYAFGKSKDVPVTNDRGFGEWMLRETSDFPPNTKAVVRSILYKK